MFNAEFSKLVILLLQLSTTMDVPNKCNYFSAFHILIFSLKFSEYFSFDLVVNRILSLKQAVMISLHVPVVCSGTDTTHNLYENHAA